MTSKSRLIAASLLLLSAAAGPTRADEHARMMGQGTADTRKPLPLLAMMAEHQKANMRDHLAAVQAIVAALARDDMDGVSKGAARIGYSESMGQMCEHMGAAAPGFTAMAFEFHHTADTIGEAARKADRAGALTALDRTLQACVACHAVYRQEVVDEATWKRLAGEAAGH